VRRRLGAECSGPLPRAWTPADCAAPQRFDSFARPEAASAPSPGAPLNPPASMRSAWPVIGLGLIALLGQYLGGVAGTIAIYPALGVFPGLAAALVLGWRWSRGRRWLIGLTLSPLVSASAGWALMAAGVPLPSAARAVALAGFAAWAVLEALRARSGEAPAEAGAPLPRAVRWLGLGLAGAIALPPLLNPFVYVHNDGWVHAGLAWEIAVRGMPPQDPRFAGMPINYVWFYNLFLGLFAGLPGRGGPSHDPFIVMATLNVIAMVLFVRFAYHLGYAVWRDRGAATGAALLVTLGFNAGAWLLWPLRFLTALGGYVRGMPAVRQILQDVHLLDDRVFYALGAPFAYPVNFLDKFLLGSPLAYTWLLILFYLDAVLEWLRAPRVELLACAALAISGILLFHAVPGLSGRAGAAPPSRRPHAVDARHLVRGGARVRVAADAPADRRAPRRGHGAAPLPRRHDRVRRARPPAREQRAQVRLPGLHPARDLRRCRASAGGARLVRALGPGARGGADRRAVARPRHDADRLPGRSARARRAGAARRPR